jgi:hypothetical protein
VHPVEVTLALTVLDAVVDLVVRPALAPAQAVRMPRHVERFVAVGPVLLQGLLSEVAERTDAVGVDDQPVLALGPGSLMLVVRLAG